jgi:hypothetical protein
LSTQGVQWPDMLKDVVLLLLDGIGTAVWFFWRRKAEQAPVFENIQKAEKLLSLRKELDKSWKLAVVPFMHGLK